MFRKIFIFLLIGVSLQKTEVEATGGLLSGLLAAPLNLASGALSIVGGVVDDAFDIASILTSATSYIDAMANHILRCSHKLVQNILGGLNITLSILQSASLDIVSALSRFCESVSIARDHFLDRLGGAEKDIVRGSMEKGKQFLLGLMQSGQIMLDTTRQKYDNVVKDISSLAEDLINEAKAKNDEAKVAALEAIAENIKKLQNESTELCENLSDAVKNATDELNDFQDNINVENKFEDVISTLTNAWSKANKNIEDMKQEFKKICEAGGDVDEDLKSRFDDCRKQFEEINKDFEDFIEKVKISANETINDIVENSKTGIGTIFNNAMDALSNSVSGVENIAESTIDLVGDFMKDRIKCISDAKQLVVDTLNDARNTTGDTLNKLSDIAHDFTFEVEKTSSGILDMTFKRFMQIIKTVDESVNKGCNAIRNVADQTMDLVNKTKTEISAAVKENMNRIKSTHRSATETIKNIATGVAGIIKDTTESIRNLFSNTISAAQAAIANKIDIFMSIASHGVNGTRRLLKCISTVLINFQNSLHTVLANFRDESQQKISQGIQAINNLSNEFLGYLQKKYIQGSKKYIECSRTARQNLQDTMPSLMEKVRSCGKAGITSVVQTIDTSLCLEEGMAPKIEELLNRYNICRRERSLRLRCLKDLEVDKTLGLYQAFTDVIKGKVEAGKNMVLCNAEYIDESRNYFAKLREEFDNCIKKE